jgi:hypothetical protein
MVVRAKDENFIASFVNGTWSADLPFDAYELEDILLVDDADEAKRIYDEAKRALKSKPAVA